MHSHSHDHKDSNLTSCSDESSPVHVWNKFKYTLADWLNRFYVDLLFLLTESEIIFPRREGTYLTERCSSSNFLGDWYEQYLCSVFIINLLLEIWMCCIIVHFYFWFVFCILTGLPKCYKTRKAIHCISFKQNPRGLMGRSLSTIRSINFCLSPYRVCDTVRLVQNNFPVATG